MAFDPASCSLPGLSSLDGDGAGTSAVASTIDLNLSMRNVPKLDYFSPSDPFVIVSLKCDDGKGFKQVAITEIVWDNPNPNFAKEITLEYRFEEVQTVRLDAYDSDLDDIGTDMTKHDYIGYCEFILGDCVTADGQKLALKMKDKHGRALMNKSKPVVAIARVQELTTENRDDFIVTFGVKGLPKMDWFGKADPFLEVYRMAESGDWASIHRTEFYKNTLKCTFKPVKLAVRRLCNGDVDRPILIRCFDWNKAAEPDFIGECEVTLAHLTGETAFDLIRPAKGKKKAKKRGQLLVVKQKLLEKHSFLEFVTGGLDINLIVAIDFTGSNGDPRDSKSLHYMGPPKYESDYLRVIKSVGRILESYDSDGMIPVFGFGANLSPPRKEISHCFPLTFASDPEVSGIDGVISVYSSTLKRVQLYGPTYFNEVIRKARSMSSDKQNPDALEWTILLIITDGVINDMKKTVAEIVTCTYTAALSIIIVGVGKGDARRGFTAMEVLDADDEPLIAEMGPYATKEMAADIVQFVEFNEYKCKHIGALAKEVLIEVPGQVEDYMARNEHFPGKPKLLHSRSASYGSSTNLYDGPSGLAAQRDSPVPGAGGHGGYGAIATMSASGGAAPRPYMASASGSAYGAPSASGGHHGGGSHAYMAFNPHYQA